LLRKTTRIAVYLIGLACSLGRIGWGTYPAITARLLFCALSDSTEARTAVGRTNARTRNSFPTLLVRKDNANIGPRTKMQKDRLTSVCSVRLTAFSE